MVLREAYEEYLASTKMKPRARDSYEHLWRRIGPELGHLYIEAVDTSVMDALKRKLPKHLGPRSVNHHLVLIRAVLRFAWRRGKLKSLPYVPLDAVPKAHVDWYTQKERDQLLEGIFRLEPQWYLFFYLSARLGLRSGEVYAISYRQIRREPAQLIVDQAVQRGSETRLAELTTRKTDEAYVLDITLDILTAIAWHQEQGYGGPEFLFSKTGEFPRYVDSHKRPLKLVQSKLGLRRLSHHKLGRHSVASQAVTSGVSIKAVQAQLGHASEQSTHRYSHLGAGAQKRLVESLTPASIPHGVTPEGRRSVPTRATSDVNDASTRASHEAFARCDVILASTELAANNNT